MPSLGEWDFVDPNIFFRMYLEVGGKSLIDMIFPAVIILGWFEETVTLSGDSRVPLEFSESFLLSFINIIVVMLPVLLYSLSKFLLSTATFLSSASYLSWMFSPMLFTNLSKPSLLEVFFYVRLSPFVNARILLEWYRFAGLEFYSLASSRTVWDFIELFLRACLAFIKAISSCWLILIRDGSWREDSKPCLLASFMYLSFSRVINISCMFRFILKGLDWEFKLASSTCPVLFLNMSPARPCIGRFPFVLFMGVEPTVGITYLFAI